MKNEARPLPLLDYERISSTVYSVLASEKGAIHKACLFFGIAGANMLSLYYGIRAQIIAGAALYRIGAGSSDVLALVQPTDAGITSTPDGFHCWIETDDGWLLDFHAPLFPEMAMEAGTTLACPRRMFQRRVIDQAASPAQLQKPGDFLYLPNEDLTATLLDDFGRTPAYTDLVGIMVNWYRRPPKKMQSAIGVGNARGEVKGVPLRRLVLTGAW